MTDQHHGISYIEFQTTDLEASKAFCASVFGWTFTDYGPTYAAFSGAGVEGGFELADDVAGGGTPVLVVLYSDDLEATLTSVTAAGATIVKPTFAFPGGRRFHFAVPGGAHMAVWSE